MRKFQLSLFIHCFISVLDNNNDLRSIVISVQYTNLNWIFIYHFIYWTDFLNSYKREGRKI